MQKQQLQQELKQAMLDRNTAKTAVLRFILSGLTYYEIQKGGAGYEATEEDVLTVIQKEAKQRRDSIAEYTKANRQDLVAKESQELQILQSYLPEQLSEETIYKLVKEAITQTGAKSIAEMGKVMACLIPTTKGKADGSLVSRIVKEELAP